MDTKRPWKFERRPEYVERARLLGQELQPHEGYFRDNDGSWIILDATGERVCTVAFKGKAKRSEAWKAPDTEGQAIAEFIVNVVNARKD